MPYRCTIFERNQSTGRVFLVGSMLLLHNGTKKNKKKKVKKIGQFSGTHISRTTRLISFKFGMQDRVYGEHKICEFDRN